MILARAYIDSNVFFYAKIGDRVYGKSCSEVVRRISSGKIEGVMSSLVPLEVSNAMRKFGLGSEASAEIGAMLSLGMEIFPFEMNDLEEVIKVMSECDVGPYDCAHAVAAKRNGITEVISADRAFDKFDWIHRVDPGEAIGTG